MPRLPFPWADYLQCRPDPVVITTAARDACIAESRNFRDTHMDAALVLSSVIVYLLKGETLGYMHPKGSSVAPFFGGEEPE